MKIMMKSTKPYLLEAMHRWIVDSGATPYILARTDILGVVVPEGYAKDNKIVLNVSDQAVHDLSMTEHLVTFEAAFGGVEMQIRLPMPAILAIHASENGLGIEFEEEQFAPPASDDDSQDTGGEGGLKAGDKPELRVL